ncbi:MAG: hypothetical protein R3257_04015, partial [bacterium]|nr:hypothetical protein [bacterium]
EGGNEQYGLVRIPKASVGVQEGRPYYDLGAGNFLLNIFLKRPQRGGSFRWDTPYRWKAAETLEKRNP